MTKNPNPSVFIDRETIRLTRDGLFLSDGVEIAHARTVDAFHRFLGRDSQGYFISIGADFKRIEVEDTAYFVSAIEWKGADSVELRLLDGTREMLDPTTLSFREGRLTCRVKDGQEAKFLRQPYLDFLMRALADEGGYTVQVAGKSIRLESAAASRDRP